MWDTLMPVEPSRAAEFYERGWWRKETFLDDLARAVANKPEAPAIIAYRDGAPDRTLSYRELAATVDRFAGALTELGVGRGDVVLVHLPNWWMLAPLYLACARLRAVVATASPPFGGQELGQMLEMTRAKVCVVADTYAGTGYAKRLEQVAPATLRHRVVVGDAALPSGAERHPTRDTPSGAERHPTRDTPSGAERHPTRGALDFTEFFTAIPWEREHPVASLPLPQADDVAHIVFSSGTTGRPKGIAHSFNTMWVMGRTFSDTYQLGPDDVINIPQYLAHLAGSAYSVWMSVALGATCVMQDAPDMQLLLDLVEAHRVTLVFGAPVYIRQMIAAQRERPRDISSLRCLNTGAAPIPPQLVAEARDALGVRLDSNFGMSECGAITITRASDPEGWAAHSDGSPVEWMQVRIDASPGEQTGRLLIRGASLCLGYVNQPEAFAAAVDADGWFDTGDTARDDGRGGIRLAGRRVDLIIRSNGQMLPTLEVEAILGQHPAVRDVVLVGYPDPDAPGAELACAMVVPGDPPPALEELRRFLDQRQRAERDWPDRLELVDELPRNPHGKVLRRVLRERIH